ncbi:hypothetical protein T02_7223 [Trichinella nativa]|uniref:Uncharacterized protein n=1 Tax=Trichinella nativa TaxID=6335 RepID=A0A0V1KT49_9BILA|nr:hypothetical protein T02_7223 [Trichinella nativa]
MNSVDLIVSSTSTSNVSAEDELPERNVRSESFTSILVVSPILELCNDEMVNFVVQQTNKKADQVHQH